MIQSSYASQFPVRPILLAPMEGVGDAPMRDVLTRISPYDFAVTPFIRISDARMPWKRFRHACPELGNGGRTASGTPVIVQLLGQNPVTLAKSAAHLVKLSPVGIDLNFGCPAPLVNRHGGGAALLETPEKIQEIVSSVRKSIPPSVMFSVKIRLGVTDTARAVDCAQAVEAGGADYLIVHARTRSDGYKFPARWEWIATIRDAVRIPVVANGDINSVEAYHACLAATGCQAAMIGRQAICDPFLVRHIRQGQALENVSREHEWEELLPYLAQYWQQTKIQVTLRHAPGRIKLWLSYLRQHFTEGALLYEKLRTATRIDEVETVMRSFGVPV